jgi:hypothetical protein
VSDARHDDEPRTRRERLKAIADEYTEEIHDPRAERQLGGAEGVSRYAAVTSEGAPESSHYSNGNLIVAESTEDLARELQGECGEGWVAHGRVWDLDSHWHLWGNLEVSYSVSVGGSDRPPCQAVVVDGREDGLHLFEDPADAEAFRAAVRRHGGEASLTEEPIHDHRGAEALIDAEREG